MFAMVERDSTSDADERETDRRSVLKTGAVGLATLATSGTALAASNRSNKASDVHAAKGTANSPVSEKQRKQLRKRAVAEYERNTGNTMGSIPASRPGADDVKLDSPNASRVTSSDDGRPSPSESGDGEVVAFAYGIDANGVAREYTGLASASETAQSEDRAKGLIHNRFEGRVREISNKLEASDSDVTTQGAGGTVNNLDNMDQTYESKLEYANDPYGVVSSTNYWLLDTEYNEDGTLHGFHTPMTIEPGKIAFGSGWKNEKAWKRHYWDRNDMAWQEVDNGYWKPAGPSDGGSVSTTHSISVTVGWSPGVSYGVSWGYSEPAMERVDETSQYNDYCSWRWVVNDRCGGSVRKSTLAMQPTSTCEMEDHDCSMGKRDITYNEVEGRFTDDCSGWHSLRTWTTFYFDC